MGRILGIDYGRKRTGVAVTDTLQIVANALGTVPTHTLEKFLQDYMAKETVDAVVVGLPTQMSGEPSESMRYVTPFLNRMKKLFPELPVILYDERFTSAIAQRAMIDGGMKKQQRQEKGKVDSIAATIILNDYLQSIKPI